MYFKENSLVKVELALARGKKSYDKRESIAKRDAQRDIEGNVNAYANAAYVLDSLYGDAEKALAALDEGIAANPGSSELEFQKGSLLLLDLKSPEKAENAFRAALAKIPADKKILNRDDIDADLLTLRTLAFLGRLAHDRGDTAAARGYLEQARAINPDHTATKSLQRLVDVP